MPKPRPNVPRPGRNHSKNQSWSVMLWFCRVIGKRPSRSQRQAIVIFCSASSAQSKMWWPASSCRAVWCSTRLESDLDALLTKFHLRNKLKQADPKLNPSMQAKNAIRLIIESFSSTSPSGSSGIIDDMCSGPSFVILVAFHLGICLCF